MAKKSCQSRCVNDQREPAFKGDPMFYRILASGLGLMMVSSVIGAIFLTYVGKDVPQLLTMMGTFSIGIITGLLAAPR